MVDEHLKEKKVRDLQFDQIEREVDKRIDKMKSVLEHKEATIDELRLVAHLLLENGFLGSFAASLGTGKSSSRNMEASQNMRNQKPKISSK